ncbi:MAG: DNRLRE domain-containing protein, partial [Clostridia bacterium]|nr:DNRLRE domain-containing protein [Clostridia bacterium]
DMTPEQVTAWKESYAEANGVVPFLMTWQHGVYQQSGWLEVSDGQFGWIELDDKSVQSFSKNGVFKSYANLETAKANHDATVAKARNYIELGLVDFYAEALTPGFDSTGCWGWGEGPSKVEPGENGELYEYKWQAAVENGFPMVVIPTWDDWGEASTIEPSLQYGVEYLEITRKYAAQYKEIEANTASLELPGWIYKIRKTTKDAEILAVMDVASQMIADCRYDEAEALVRPYVESTGIPATSKEFFKYPTTLTSPLVPAVMETENKPTVEGDTETWKAVADTYVTLSITGAKDAGTESKMMVKKDDGSSLTRSSYIKFDTTDTTLLGASKATLRIYCSAVSSTDTEQIDLNLYAVSTEWDELSFDWNTQPMTIQKIADIDMSTVKTDRWVEIDVTAYVQANLGKAIAFAIRSEGADSSVNITFSTREIRRKEPQLVLVKGEPGEGAAPMGEMVTLISAGDTYVQKNGREDYGTAAMLRIKSDDSNSLTRRAFIKFDTSVIENDSVAKATLRVYCLFASDKSSEIKNRDYKIYAVSSEWEEIGMRWESQPTLGEKIADVDTQKAKKGVWLEIDVTDYVNANMGGFVSFAICNDGPSSSENHINLGSREAAGQEPQLVVIVP